MKTTAVLRFSKGDFQMPILALGNGWGHLVDS